MAQHTTLSRCLALTALLLPCSDAFSMPSLFMRQEPGLVRRNDTQLPTPFNWGNSQEFDGNDGPWSTFPILAGEGNQAQLVRILPSTVGTFTWLPSADGCPAFYQQQLSNNCAAARGGLFLPNQSTTWQRDAPYNFQIELNLGLDSSGNLGFETLTLGFVGSGGPTVKRSIVQSYTDPKYWLGEFGLRPYPTNLTDQNGPQPSYLQRLFNESLIPSLTYGYTAGNQYRLNKVFGSLILGGYDENRMNGSGIQIPFGEDISRDLLVNLKSIKTDSGSPQNLLPGGEISIFVDSTISQLYLPATACQAFEQAFGLTYTITDNSTGTGFYMLNSTHRTTLLQNNANVTFTIGSADTSGPTVDIVMPYEAFDLQLTYPNVPNSTYYFPLQKAANATQYTLGRTFLQEAYLIADYERQVLTIAPCSWNASTTSKPSIKSIISPTLGGSSASNTSSSSGISGGAIAGIAIAIVAVVAIIGLIIFFLRRRKTKKRRLAELEASEAKGHGKAGSTSPSGANGADSALLANGELGADGERFELNAPFKAPAAELDTPKHEYSEMSAGDYYGPGKNFAHEMEGAAQIHEMPGSNVYEMPAAASVDKKEALAREARQGA